MSRAITLVLMAWLLPAAAWAQAIDVQVGQQQTDTGGNTPIAGLGLGLALGALSGPPKLAFRDADIPQASTTDVLFMLDAGSAAAALAATGGVDLAEAARLDSLNLTMAVGRLRQGDTAAAAIVRLSNVPGVLWAQQNHIYQLMGNGTALPKRFALHHIPVMPPVAGTIALIDSAVALSHDALRGATIRQEPLRANMKPGIHGTAIASLLVGTGQVPGMARGAQLVSFAAFEEQAKGPALAQSRTLAKALDAAVKLKPHVLNLSFGGAADVLLARLLDAAHTRGICVAAAAGNGGKNGQVPFPASHPASLAITAVDEKLRAYEHATPGSRIDVAGVGVNLLAATPKGYRQMSGTSFAAAVVAGALLRSVICTGAAPMGDLRAAAAATAQDLGAPGKDAIFGAGLFQSVQ
jgi:subtilisin family serine protease